MDTSGSANSGLPFGLDCSQTLQKRLGAHGLPEHRLASHLADLAPAMANLVMARAQKSLGLLSVVDDVADIEAAEAVLAELSRDARTLVFFGTGGSGLGGQMLAQVTGWGIPGSADKDQKLRPRTRFYDNLDGQTLAGALLGLDLATTRFVVTSKSGNTVETLAQAIAALDAVNRAGLGKSIPKLFLGLTEPSKPSVSNGLRALFEKHAIPILPHHTGIGGRFSVLSNVGLVPGLARGLDVRALRRGAARVLDQMAGAKSPGDVPAAVGAAIVVGLARDKLVTNQIIWPYADRLQRLGPWFVQLWAESLGKAGHGTTPLACLGPLDQHSQLQLFMDGPRSHLITILRQSAVPLHSARHDHDRARDVMLDVALAWDAGISFLGGRTVSELVAAQAHAVPDALARAGRPVRIFTFDRLDAETVGALIMHFMLETILAAHLFGVDPYDQPAVELAKILTRQRFAAQ